MTGDYTRFEHALRDIVRVDRFSWRPSDNDILPAVQDGPMVLLSGATPVGYVVSSKAGELVCSAVNYMLGLHKQVGPDEDYRDDMLARAQTALRAVGQVDLADEIRMHLMYIHKEHSNAAQQSEPE